LRRWVAADGCPGEIFLPVSAFTSLRAWLVT
jgi:hypothetical protein